MEYYVDIPHACPVRFVPVSPEYDPRYNTKHFDDFWFHEQLRSFEQPAKYYQKWQQNDVIKIQVKSTVGQPEITIYNHEQKIVIAPLLMTLVPTSIIGQPWNIYEITLSIGTIKLGDPLDEGYYWFRMLAGVGEDQAQAISEGIWIKEKHEDTVLAEYSHNENDFDTIWETGYAPSMRIPGVLLPMEMNFKRATSSYDDQIKNHKKLSSVPYRNIKFIITDDNGLGVPPWIADKLNFIFSCSSVKLDGKNYVADEGAELEKQRIAGYPKGAWTIDLREGTAYSKRVNGGGGVGNITIVYNIRTNMFGYLNAPPSTIDLQITETQ